jgi:hypothetical protein
MCGSQSCGCSCCSNPLASAPVSIPDQHTYIKFYEYGISKHTETTADVMKYQTSRNSVVVY